MKVEEKSEKKNLLKSALSADLNDLPPSLQEKISIYQQSHVILKFFLSPTLFPLKIKANEFLNNFPNEIVIANLFKAFSLNFHLYKYYLECIISLYDSHPSTYKMDKTNKTDTSDKSDKSDQFEDKKSQDIQYLIKKYASIYFNIPPNLSSTHFFPGLREVMLHIFGELKCVEKVKAYYSTWSKEIDQCLYLALVFAPEFDKYDPDFLQNICKNINISSSFYNTYNKEINLVLNHQISELKEEIELKVPPNSIEAAILKDDVKSIQKFSLNTDFNINNSIKPLLFFPNIKNRRCLTYIEFSALVGSV